MKWVFPCSRQKFAEFWNCGSGWSARNWYKDRFDPELVEKLMSSLLGINFLYLNDDVKMGCAPEICEYYGLPLPAEAKPEGIRKILNGQILEGWKFCKWLWDDAVTKFPDHEWVATRNKQFWDSVQHTTETLEQSVGLLEKIADALVPYVMHAHEKKEERSRVRALYGIVMMQKQIHDNYLRGFKAKVASFQ